MRLYLHLAKRSVRSARSRALAAFAALLVTATVITALLTLRLGLDAKLHREFRRYGANIVMVSDAANPPGVAAVRSTVGADSVVVPYAYVVGQLGAGDSVVVAGTDLAAMRLQNPAWQVDPGSANRVLIGKRVLKLHPGPAVRVAGRALVIPNFAALESGGPEEQRIYVSAAMLERLTGLRPNTFQISAGGDAGAVQQTISRLQAAFPQAEVRPIRQVVEAEARAFSKASDAFLWASLLIALTATLCVLSSLTSSVLERQKDVAVLKALGSSRAQVRGIFLAEWSLIAVAGGLGGYALGALAAAWIGRAVFHAPFEPLLVTLPIVMAACLGIAGLAALFPLSRLETIQPAVMLKGE